MKQIPNLILIAGSGRNIGKTHFCCKLIEEYCKTQKVIAIKTSRFMHPQDNDLKVLAQEDKKWLMGQETNKDSHKDSGRFLQAGASKVYYAQYTDDIYVPEIIKSLAHILNENVMVICESASWGQFITPGKAYFINDESLKKKCSWSFAYEEIISEDGTLIL